MTDKKIIHILHCAPIELVADFSGLFCLGSIHLQLTDDEVLQIIASCNEMLCQENMQLEINEDRHWHLISEDPIQIQTTALSDIVGKPINNCLPQGTDYQKWCRLLTELQLLLAQHPVNQRRVEQGLPQVNSLWFWHEDKKLTLWQRILKMLNHQSKSSHPNS